MTGLLSGEWEHQSHITEKSKESRLSTRRMKETQPVQNKKRKFVRTPQEGQPSGQ